MIPTNVMNVINKFCPNIGNLQNIQNPEDFVQLLLNSGRVNQAQVNQARQMWNNPQIQQRINNQFFN